MINKKSLRIQFMSHDDMMKELIELPITKKRYIQPKNVIIFDTLSSFRNFLTLQKLELLILIASEKPKSIYELAKIVDRAIAPVQKDCASLASVGFIILKKEKGGRRSMAPSLKFDYDKIVVEIPLHPYELSFKSVA